MTPLLITALNGHIDVVKFLLLKGVKVNQQDNVL